MILQTNCKSKPIPTPKSSVHYSNKNKIIEYAASVPSSHWLFNSNLHVDFFYNNGQMDSTLRQITNWITTRDSMLSQNNIYTHSSVKIHVQLQQKLLKQSS